MFKLSEVEMERLLADRCLKMKIHIGKSHFGIAIDLNTYKELPDYKESLLRFLADQAEPCLMLHTTPEEIQKLVDMGKDRNGLSFRSGSVECRLQVDVRNDSRSRNKPQ
ncbi:MAG: hypothetical protein J0G29_03335 [Alphaproteobacteria bacterium]|nr:hypothetical protein [Alphaproteobacteria bacterium]